ncbi:hypothetical protein Pelo_1611 [Pelomyxa schiedti]|nr:hypothetical protein Pelo_1611 [Pelomyxa schiedti]
MLFSQFSSPQHPTIAIPASPGTTSTSAHGSSHNWESTAGPTPSLSSLLQQHFDFGNMQIPVATTHQQQLPQHHHIQQHNESQSHTPSDTNNTHTTNTSPGIHSHQHQHQSHNVNTGSPAQHHSPTIGTAEESSITLGTKPLPNFSALTAALFTVSNNS